MRKPQGGLLSFRCGFEKIIIVFNGKFVTESAILKSNYSAMKRTQCMKLMTITHYILLDITGPAVADLHTKVSGTRPPQQDQILSFLHMFSPKSACVGGWRPHQRGLAPPNGKSWIRPCWVSIISSDQVYTSTLIFINVIGLVQDVD